MPSPFTGRVYEVVQQIPKGFVASYGQVAMLAGNPRGARGVGFILHPTLNPGSSPIIGWCFVMGRFAVGLRLAARAGNGNY